MKKLFLSLAAAACLTAPGYSYPASSPICAGKFPFLMDTCWSCVFPITFFDDITVLAWGQEGTKTLQGSWPLKPICSCVNGAKSKIGIPVSFWEPSRMVDVVSSTYCFANLGGQTLDFGVNSLQYGSTGNTDVAQSGGPKKSRSSFWHMHWYINPMMSALGIIADNQCLDNQGYDIAYVSEIDPAWGDAEIENLLEPDAFAFGNIMAQTACSVDALCASGVPIPGLCDGTYGGMCGNGGDAGFGLNCMPWCAGANGSLYPMTGFVQAHIGDVQATSLILQRSSARMHRMGIQWASTGVDGLCGYYPQIQMDKREYKFQIVNPITQGKGDGTGTAGDQTMQNKMNSNWQGSSGTNNSSTVSQGRCCQPFGRTSVLYGAGKELPHQSANYGYQIFKKRDCCQNVPLN